MYGITYVYLGLQGLLQVEGLKTPPSIIYQLWFAFSNFGPPGPLGSWYWGMF